VSVWATILELQHPDERDAALAGFPVVFVETDEGRAEEERLGSPWAFEHSGVIPERDGLRRGSVSLSSLPAFVEDARRAVPEEQFRDGDLPWLRLIVRIHPLPDEGDQAIVVLDREQDEAMRDALDGWISRLEAAEPDGGFSASRWL
jgi:hypothetical protein